MLVQLLAIMMCLSGKKKRKESKGGKRKRRRGEGGVACRYYSFYATVLCPSMLSEKREVRIIGFWGHDAACVRENVTDTTNLILQSVL